MSSSVKTLSATHAQLNEELLHTTPYLMNYSLLPTSNSIMSSSVTTISATHAQLNEQLLHTTPYLMNNYSLLPTTPYICIHILNSNIVKGDLYKTSR